MSVYGLICGSATNQTVQMWFMPIPTDVYGGTENYLVQTSVVTAHASAFTIVVIPPQGTNCPCAEAPQHSFYHVLNEYG